GQYGHDLNRIARKIGEVGVFFEELRGSLMRLSAHDRKGAHFVADVADATFRDLLRLPQRSSHGDDGRLMLLNPRLPGCYALLLFGAALAFGKSIPRRSPRAGFAAKKQGEIGTGSIHDDLAILVSG